MRKFLMTVACWLLLSLLTVLFGLCSAPVAQAQSSGSSSERITVSFQNESFSPERYVIDNKVYLRLEDPEIKRLLSRTSGRLTASASGRTLMVYCPLRQTTIHLNDSVMQVNGQSRPAPGLMRIEGDRLLIEPGLLFYALGLQQAVQGKDTDSLCLLPCVGKPSFTVDTEGRVVRLALATAVRWSSSADGNSLELVFPDCAWEDEAKEFYIDDVLLKVTVKQPNAVQSSRARPAPDYAPVEEVAPKRVVLVVDEEAHSSNRVMETEGVLTGEATRTQPEQDVIISFTFPANWQGRARRGLGLSEAVVSFVPQYPVGPASIFGEAKYRSTEQGQEVEVSASAPFQYYWDYDQHRRLLVVDMPGLTAQSSLPPVVKSLGGLQSSRLRFVGTMENPVLRLEAQLESGYSFEFPDNEADNEEDGEVSSFTLRIGREVTQASNQGCAYSKGFRLSRGVIVIDPGHGGGDPGCVNRSLGVYEKTVTLDVALRLRDILEAKGWTVVLTRNTDRDVSWRGSPDNVELQSRVDVANDNAAAYFISLHCNASVSSRPYGSSIHWSKPEDYELAQWFRHALGPALGLGDGGLQHDNFYLLRNSDMPAVLVEMAFLTNPREGAMLASPNFRQRIAEGLARALEENVTGSYARNSRTANVRTAP